MASSAMASPKLLFNKKMADPRAFILDGNVWFSGTYKKVADDPKIYFHYLPLSQLNSSNPSSHVVEDGWIYNPEVNPANDEYSEVMSASMFVGVGGSSTLMWSAKQNYPCLYGDDNPGDGLPCSEAETGLMATDGGYPAWLNPGSSTLPHSEKFWTDESVNPGAGLEWKRIRMPSDIYHDDTNGDGIVQSNEPQWNLYNYYWHGNHVSMWQWKGDGAGTTINIADPPDWGCAEGGVIFKRNGMYYLVFTRGWYNAGYNMVYKMASSVAGLAGSIERPLSYALPSNQGVWNASKGEYGFTKNAGNGDVVQNGSTYTIMYHVATPTDDGYMYHSEPWQNIQRYLYVDTLSFNGDGTIIPITLP